MSKYSKYSPLLSFVDMLFALLIGVFSIFIISTMLLGEPKSGKKIDEASTIMLDMTWDDMSADDMDLWCMGPDQDKIGYAHRENSYMSLDRDDLGVENDYYTVNGQKKLIRHNEEIIRIRKMVPGHYVVNVMFYARKQDPETYQYSHGPQQVKVVLLQVNPVYRLVFSNVVEIPEPSSQVTAFSFDIVEHSDGPATIENLTTEQNPFLQQYRNNGGAGGEDNNN